jgi:O-antigen/teichoic acid export membrane protein
LNNSERSLSTALPLRVNFSWTFAGNVIYAGCQWAMLIVLAKLGTPEMVGEFVLAVAITGPIYMFAGLRLWHVQATDAAVEYRFGDYLGLIIITAIMAQAVVACIALSPGYRGETALVIFIVGAAKAFEAVSEVHYGLLMHIERMDRIGKSMMIKGPLSLVAMSMGVSITGSIVWGVAGLAAVWASALFSYDIPNAAQALRYLTKRISPSPQVFKNQDSAIHPHWEKKILMKLAWFALPLGVITLLISLNINIPFYFVEGYLGKRELGIFAALAYIQRVGPTVVNSLGYSASAKLSQYHALSKKLAFQKLLIKLVSIAALLGGAGVLTALVVGRQILTLIYGPEYALESLFLWIMVAAAIDYVATALYFGMLASRYFRIQVPLFFAATGIAVLACRWLVPLYGLSGAAMAIILSNLVRAIGSLLIIFNAVRAQQFDS